MNRLIYPPLVTLRDYLRLAVSRFNTADLFYGHGTDNAYDEAVYLLLATLNLSMDQLDVFLDAKLLPQEAKAILYNLDQRVKKRLPTAYLTRQAWLGPYRFYVDERVIVPRSFIAEILLNDGLSAWIPDACAVTRVLDVCTGSGCLAILLTQLFPNATIDASDLSSAALDVAALNVAHYRLTHRIQLHCGNLFSPVRHKRYDLIVANPPYVNQDAMGLLPPEYQQEPRLALEGGKEGLDCILRILKRAHQYLEPGGYLMVEIGQNRDALEKHYPTTPFMWLPTETSDDAVFLITQEDAACIAGSSSRQKALPVGRSERAQAVALST